MNIKKVTGAALVSAAFALGATPAQAVPILTLSDGVSPVVSVSDGGVGDLNPLSGAVTFMGALGSWYLNVTTGVSNNPAPSGQPAWLDLNSVDASSAGAGTLTITLSESGLTTPARPNTTATVEVGGTVAAGTGNSASFSVKIEDAVSNPLAAIGLGPYGPGGFSGSSVAAPIDTLSSAFGIVETAVITHKTAGVTSFDLITYVSEPATLGLLGLALVALGFGRRRRAV